MKLYYQIASAVRWLGCIGFILLAAAFTFAIMSMTFRNTLFSIMTMPSTNLFLGLFLCVWALANNAWARNSSYAILNDIKRRFPESVAARDPDRTLAVTISTRKGLTRPALVIGLGLLLWVAVQFIK